MNSKIITDTAEFVRTHIFKEVFFNGLILAYA